MKPIYILLITGLTLTHVSCKKFMDIVPDNVPTIDNAFSVRVQAERYLYTCYSFLPNEGSPSQNMAFFGGNECWTPYPNENFSTDAFSISMGLQNATNPFMNAWDGERSGPALFQAINTCNIFLENIHKVPDMTDDERARWIGEAEFLKAFYHFYLLRMYGPIPIIDRNLPISASPEEVKVVRMPVDEVVNYISALLDKAAEKLPSVILNEATELGRATKPAALSIKARLLVMAASPLFNGNPDFTTLKNAEGINLINAQYDQGKWLIAADACKMAITESENASRRLYTFIGGVFPISAVTTTQMSIRNSVCEKWNQELIWGNSIGSTVWLQQMCMAHIDPANATNYSATSQLAATMDMAELFYSKNGVPINEDKTLDFSDKNQLRTSVPADPTYDTDKYNLITNYPTARLNFDREPRFYAGLGFDGGVWFMDNSPTKSDLGTWALKATFGEYGSEKAPGWYSITGYFIKKLVNYKWVFTTGTANASIERYPWPVFRLADLYLLYAEALNEADGSKTEALHYLDEIRKRAGLPSVEQSWTNFSVNPNKYQSKEGLREIIHHERQIEMAFEASRYWDLIRWKEAATVLNKPVKGWDVRQPLAENYYKEKIISTRAFIVPRDYLFPIKQNNLNVNKKLVQNPGW